MAKQIADFEVPAWTAANDWKKFADGKAWELSRGEDFTQPAAKAAATFRKWVQRNNLSCRVVVVDENTMRVRTFPKTEA